VTDIRLVLASNIRERRKKLNLSQDELAAKIHSATGYIGMIERAKQFPSPLMLEKIAAALQVDTPDLFSVIPLRFESLNETKRDILIALDKIINEKIFALEGD